MHIAVVVTVSETLSFALSCPALPCPALPCPVMSYPVMSYPVMSYPVMFHPVMSCPVMSCPVLSCLTSLYFAMSDTYFAVSTCTALKQALAAYFQEESIGDVGGKKAKYAPKRGHPGTLVRTALHLALI